MDEKVIIDIVRGLVAIDDPEPEPGPRIPHAVMIMLGFALLVLLAIVKSG